MDEQIIVFEVDLDQLASPVQEDPVGGGRTYPHIYGPLNMDAVTATWKLVRGRAGFDLGSVLGSGDR